jgi:hypothetical protein
MKPLIIGIFLSMALACSDRPSSTPTISSPAAESAVSVIDKPQQAREISAPVREAMLIRESYLRFETTDIEKTYQTIISSVKDQGGYLQSDELNKGYNEWTRTLVVRIPSQNFQKTLDAISKNVPFFDERRISSSDVTEEFIDVEARLKTERSLEARYTQLLQKAQSIKDILEIERELAAVRAEIESKQGRLNYLTNRISYSTITISLYKRTADSGVTISYGRKMWNAVKSGFDGLSLFLLGLLHIWPLFVLGGMAAIVIFRKKIFGKK